MNSNQHKVSSYRNKMILYSIIVVGLNLFSGPALGESVSPTRAYDQLEEAKNLASLENVYGVNKKLPKDYELQALLALSHYPELKEVKVNFIIRDVGIPLSSRPHWSSMLRSAKNRTYNVVIDNSLEGAREVLLLKNQPFNAQVGIIGHELSHTVYYLERSFFGIIRDALCQFSQCRIEFERNTDRRLIEHGLGWQRLDHARFVRQRLAAPQHISNATAEGGAYMNPSELLELIESNEAYTK